MEEEQQLLLKLEILNNIKIIVFNKVKIYEYIKKIGIKETH